jgi:hypothetical protein
MAKHRKTHSKKTTHKSRGRWPKKRGRSGRKLTALQKRRRKMSPQKRYVSDVAARNRRKDIKRYGSIKAARAARKREQAETQEAQQAANKATGAARKREWEARQAHTTSPTSSSTATPRRATSREHCDRVEKLQRLSTSSNPHEAALAKQRARELQVKYGDC